MGFKVPEDKHHEIAGAAKRLGLPTTSALIRCIVDGWIRAYNEELITAEKSIR